MPNSVPHETEPVCGSSAVLLSDNNLVILLTLKSSSAAAQWSHKNKYKTPVYVIDLTILNIKSRTPHISQ
jgi:hypothetical protein